MKLSTEETMLYTIAFCMLIPDCNSTAKSPVG
jgi:hypothetical protein